MRTPFYEIEVHPNGGWFVHYIGVDTFDRNLASGSAATPEEAEATARGWVEDRKRAEGRLKAYNKQVQRIRVRG